MRILVVEDEKDLNRIITKKLEKEHYSVDSCFTGDDALDYLRGADYDLVLLDIMLPGKDGFEVMKHIRNSRLTPVIFLTARDSVDDRIKGLDSGAVDYVVKPFSLNELMARVRAATRRNFSLEKNEITVDDLVLDIKAHSVKRAGKNISLSAKEYALLEYLMINRGIVLSREKIENHVWNYDYEGGTNVVDVYIRYLRQKIDHNSHNRLIHTVRGVGYVLRDDNEEKNNS